MFKLITAGFSILILLSLMALAAFYMVKSFDANASTVERIEARAYAERVQREVELKRLERQLRLAEATLSTALCENGLKLDGVGDGGRSHGFLQVQKVTFYELARKAGMKGLYWKNPYHQVKVFQWSVENGHGKKWTCYKERI